MVQKHHLESVRKLKSHNQDIKLKVINMETCKTLRVVIEKINNRLDTGNEGEKGN